MTAPAGVCPSRGFAQNPSNPSCLKCKAPLAGLDAPVGAASISREGWRALGLGLLLAAVLTAIPFFRILFLPLITIAHELGHAVVAWIFGRPAVPAFDFAYGGGVTSIEEDQRISIIVLMYGLMGYAAWRVRRHVPTLVALVGIIALYSYAAFSYWNDVLILAMGHGTELIIAGIFLYRAISGDAVLQVDERPAYAMAGLLILFHDVGFAWDLSHSEDFRDWYAEGKGGMLNDFTRVNLYLRSATVPVLGRYLLMGCGGTAVAAWLAHRYQDAIATWWDRAVK